MYSIYTDYKDKDVLQCLKNENPQGVTYLGKISKKPNVYEKVTFNGKTYIVGIVNNEEKRAYVSETQVLEPDTEFKYENNVICPYCGYEEKDSWELSGEDSVEETTDCSDCGQEFFYTRSIEVTYCSRQKETED